MTISSCKLLIVFECSNIFFGEFKTDKNLATNSATVAPDEVLIHGH